MPDHDLAPLCQHLGTTGSWEALIVLIALEFLLIKKSSQTSHSRTQSPPQLLQEFNMIQNSKPIYTQCI